MEYRQLKNYGQLYTAKASPRIWMTTFTTLPKELGFVGTPKFIAKLQSKQRHWNKKQFKTAEDRRVTHRQFIDGIRDSLAFYAAMVATCGAERTWEVYPKLAERVSVMMWEEFLPTAEDFLRCRDSWEALRQYFLEFSRTNEREGVWRFKIIKDMEEYLQIHVTDCAWAAMHDEGGCLEAFAVGSHSELIVFPRLAQRIGGDFKREDGCLCHRDPVCDWHFLRHNG